MYQVTILKYEKDKSFQIQLIAMNHASNRLKLHTYAGYTLYNNLFDLCTAIYGDNPDNWLGIIDEEIFVVRQGISRFESDIKYITNNSLLPISYWELTIKGPMYMETARIKATASIEDYVTKVKLEQQTIITETTARAIYLIK
jgi:hypothetical protein